MAVHVCVVCDTTHDENKNDLPWERVPDDWFCSVCESSIPTIFALYRARKFLDAVAAQGVSLMITGGLRVSADFAKALAMGADAVAIGISALMAIGCRQYRICNTGSARRG